MTVKLTVVVDNPTDPGAFEAHYSSPAYKEPLAKIPDVQRVEAAKVFPKEDGSPTPAYRTIDIYSPTTPPRALRSGHPKEARWPVDWSKRPPEGSAFSSRTSKTDLRRLTVGHQLLARANWSPPPVTGDRSDRRS